MDTVKIKNDLTMLTNAVNGMLSTKDEDEKNAWVTIYNARFSSIMEQIDEQEKEQNACTVNPDAEEVAPAPTPVEEEVKDEPVQDSVQDTVADFKE